MGQLKESGYEITADASEAETLVVNTCGFIESAKQESIDAILEAARLKAEGKAQRLVVAGCLVERYRDELRAEMPEVDAFIGTNQINDITKVCDERTNTRSLPVLPSNQSATYLYDESTPRCSPLRATRISSRKAGPSLRFLFHPADARPFRQSPLGRVNEAERLAERGVKEICRVAHDSSRDGEYLGTDALAHLCASSPSDGLRWCRDVYLPYSYLLTPS